MAHSIEELAEAALLEMDEATRQWAADISKLLGSVSAPTAEGLSPSVEVPRDLVNRLLAQHGCAMVGLQVASLRPTGSGDRPACMWCELAMVVGEQSR